MNENSSESALNSYPSIGIQELIETHDLRNPMSVRSAIISTNKDDKDPDDVTEEFDATAAFLGPNLWDKTLSDFKLEYLDLDEFLQDNGISDHEINRFKNSFNTKPPVSSNDAQILNKSINIQSASRQQRDQSSPENDKNSKNEGSSNKNTSVTGTTSYNLNSNIGSPHSNSSASNESYSQRSVPSTEPCEKSHKAGPTNLHKARENKTEVDLDVDYKINPNELALACVPGQNFDPANCSFSEDELKPQPMIKKSKKQFVPEEFKDDKYWARRRKNNMAAKRSREARRVKENQIVLRASYLEKENSALKEEVAKLRHDNMMLKKKIHRYEQQQQSS